MPRLGKKTLYLDLDALDRLEGALKRLPGRPSLSSYFNESLPAMADSMEEMVSVAERGGLRGLAALLQGTAAGLTGLDDDITKTVQEAKNPDKPLSEVIKDVPPKKTPQPRAKKVDKA